MLTSHLLWGRGVDVSGWGRALVFGAPRERKFVTKSRSSMLRRGGEQAPSQGKIPLESPFPLRLLAFVFFVWPRGRGRGSPSACSSNYLKQDECSPAPLPPSNRAPPRAGIAPPRLFGKIVRLSRTFVRGMRLFDEAPTCLGAVWGNSWCSMCAQFF